MWKNIKSLFAFKSRKKIKNRIEELEGYRLEESKINFVNGILENIAQTYANKKRVLRFAINEKTKNYVIKKPTKNSLNKSIDAQLSYLGNLKTKLRNFKLLLEMDSKHLKHANIVAYAERIGTCDETINKYNQQLSQQVDEIERMSKLAEIKKQNPDLFEEKEKIEFLRSACKGLYSVRSSLENEIEILKRFIDNYEVFETQFRDGLRFISQLLEDPLIKVVPVNGKIVEDKEDFFRRASIYMGAIVIITITIRVAIKTGWNLLRKESRHVEIFM